MRFASKYAGRCKFCGEPYSVGSPIDWEPGGKGAAHAECADGQINEPVKPDDPFHVSDETVEKLFAMNRETVARHQREGE